MGSRSSCSSGITIRPTSVRYSGHRARVALDGQILDGALPRRAARLVAEWAGLHASELEECWERAINHEPPGTIEPLP